jgi:hypothetical protein
MTRKKSIIVLGSTLVLISLLASSAIAQSYPNGSQITHPVAGSTGPTGPTGSYKENPESVIKATEQSAKLLNKEQMEAKVYRAKGGKPIITELKTWGYFMHTYDSKNKDYLIDPSRKVWIVQTYYPDGFPTKAGMMKNALVTSAYDAENGDTLAVLHKALPDGQSPTDPYDDSKYSARLMKSS